MLHGRLGRRRGHTPHNGGKSLVAESGRSRGQQVLKKGIQFSTSKNPNSPNNLHTPGGGFFLTTCSLSAMSRLHFEFGL